MFEINININICYLINQQNKKIKKKINGRMFKKIKQKFFKHKKKIKIFNS